MSKRLVLIVSLSLSFSFSFSIKAKSLLQGNNQLPQDFSLAMSFLQKKSEKTEQLHSQLKDLDYLLSRINEEERLMILKSELYKSFLKISRGHRVHHDLYDSQNVKNIKARFEEERSSKQIDPFITFLMQALSKDLDQYFSDPEYPSLMASLKQSTLNLSPRLLGLKKRLDMLLPWIEWYHEGELVVFEQKVMRATELALGLALERIKNFIFLSQFEDISKEKIASHDQLRFFTKKERVTSKDTDPGSAIGRLKTPSKGEKSEQQVDEKWVPRIEPDPNYRPPEKLPEPVDDWLPAPVDDWLDDI